MKCTQISVHEEKYLLTSYVVVQICSSTKTVVSVIKLFFSLYSSDDFSKFQISQLIH